MATINRKDLDRLTTKQDFYRPSELTKQEQKRLRNAIKEEREAFKNKKMIEAKDISKMSKVEASKHIYLAKTVENPYLTSEMKTVLDEIESRFRERCHSGFFIIISMTRTLEEDLKANPEISKDSPHLKGEAVDFAGKFMLKNFPDYAKILKKILIEMQKERKIYFTNEEDSTSFWHIARCPSKNQDF